MATSSGNNGNIGGKPTICTKCGAYVMFAGRGKYKCSRCDNIEYDDFGKIYKYLQEHGSCSPKQISDATGVPMMRVIALVQDGSLEPTSNSRNKLQGDTWNKLASKPRVKPGTKGYYVGTDLTGEKGKMRFQDEAEEEQYKRKGLFGFGGKKKK
ncbi:MAG: hypothetical protein IJ589_05120 [Lachnospiraceae bacterium]|nr:hypothetical protein [Lachnospiraceae bacterium]